jgi:hypothetical protein
MEEFYYQENKLKYRQRSLRLCTLAVSIFFIFGFCLHGVAGQSAVQQQPRLDADPQIVYWEQNLNDSDWHALFLLAWNLSGGSGEQAALSSFSPLVDELSVLTAGRDDQTKAEMVLEFMHTRLLKRYALYQTRFDGMLSSGLYNCVSSAVLYTILGTAAGLDVEGVKTVDHAFCSVKTGDARVDVETTNIYGFDPGTRKDFHDNFGKTTGFAYVPPGNYRDRTQISRKELFSLILSNRIVEYEQSRQYGAAVGLSIDQWAFSGNTSDSAFTVMQGEMINYGSQLVAAGMETQALAWADAAVQKYGSSAQWDSFIQYASDAQLVAALNRVKKTMKEPEFLEQVTRARQARLVPETRIRDVEIAWYLYKIDQTARTRGWQAAYAAATEVRAAAGSDSRLDAALSTCRANAFAELYNKAATAYNSRHYDEAKKLTEAAIAAFPGETALQSLLKDITDRIATGQ